MKTASLRLHHVGVLVRDINQSSDRYIDAMGYMASTAVIHDPLQAAFVRFFRIAQAHEYLELISPDSPESHLEATLRKRPGLHHICHIAQDLEAALEQAQKGKSVIVREPRPAVAFCGSRVAWVMNVDGLLMEFVEAPAQLIGVHC